MATQTTTESARNDTETPRMSSSRANNVRAFLCEDADVSTAEAAVADGAEFTREDEHRIVEGEPTYTGLFNYSTKLELSETH